MAKARRVASWTIGGIQCGLGALALILAFLIYASPLVRASLDVGSGEVYLCMFLSSVFGVLSMASGLLLVREEEE